MNVTDRIYVMRRGRISAEFSRGEADEQTVRAHTFPDTAPVVGGSVMNGCDSERSGAGAIRPSLASAQYLSGAEAPGPGPGRPSGAQGCGPERLGMAERRRVIRDRVATEGYVAVGELSAGLGVSPVTIRTDLRSLEARGALRRVHGGAVRPISLGCR